MDLSKFLILFVLTCASNHLALAVHWNDSKSIELLTSHLRDTLRQVLSTPLPHEPSHDEQEISYLGDLSGRHAASQDNTIFPRRRLLYTLSTARAGTGLFSALCNCGTGVQSSHETLPSRFDLVRMYVDLSSKQAAS